MNKDKLKIIFVDDEINALKGYRRMMHSERLLYHIDYANSAKEALDKFLVREYTIIISDLKMPVTNGIQLLEKVKELYPGTIRIILSGNSDENLALKTTYVAHQVLPKPCESELIRRIIDKSTKLRTALVNKELIDFVTGMESLPSSPTLFKELESELNKNTPSIHFVGKIASQDIAMTTKILQLANSAFFGSLRDVTSVVSAVNLLGLDIIKTLALFLKIFQQIKIPKKHEVFFENIWQHGLKVGAITRHIQQFSSSEKIFLDTAYIAGLLHDMGKLLLLKMPEYEKLILSFDDKDIPSYEAELSLGISIDHGQIGAYLLSIWGLNDRIILPILEHHSNLEINCDLTNLSTILNVSNLLANLESFNLEELKLIDSSDKLREIINPMIITQGDK